MDTEEYSTNNPFPNESNSYYGVIPGSDDCYIPFDIIISDIELSIDKTDSSCESEYGSIEITNFNSTYSYKVMDEDNNALNYSVDEDGVFQNIPPGIYKVNAKKNSCEITSGLISIEDSEQKPETPTITATDADCDSATGTITVGNYDSNLTYVLVSNDKDTQYSINNDGVFTEVAPGTYSVRAENADCNATSATATIQDSEQKPATPTISATDADCDSATGTITVENYDSNLNYVLVANDNDTEYTINNEGLFTEVAPGTYSVRAENADCNATSTTATIQDSEQKPATPTITATNADCDSATGTITVENYDSNLNYVLVANDNDTEYTINNEGLFTEVAPGTYSVRAENADCNATSATTTIQDSEQKPDTPMITATNADCDSATGTITVENYDSNLNYVLVCE